MRPISVTWHKTAWNAGLGLCAVLSWAVAISPVQAQLPQPVRGAYVTTDGSSELFAIRSALIEVPALEEGSSAPVITALSATLDGKFLAIAGDDHAIRIYDVANGSVAATLREHKDWVQAVCFEPNSRVLYSAGDDGQVLCWRHEFPIDCEVLFRAPFAIRSLCLSSESQLLAIAGFSQDVLLLDLTSKTIRHRLKCEHADQRCVRFSPDGRHVLSGGRKGELAIWDTQTGKRIASFHEHRGRIYTAAFDATGRTVTSAASDRQVIRYDLNQGRVLTTTELARAKLRSMCMLNGDWLAVAGADNSVHLFDRSSEKVVAHLQGHTGTVAVMTPCGKYLASGSFDTTVRLWDLESLDERLVPPGKPASLMPFEMDTRRQVR